MITPEALEQALRNWIGDGRSRTGYSASDFADAVGVDFKSNQLAIAAAFSALGMSSRPFGSKRHRRWFHAEIAEARLRAQAVLASTSGASGDVTPEQVREQSLGEPSTMDYCMTCGESPQSASHGPFSDAHRYVDPRRFPSVAEVEAGDFVEGDSGSHTETPAQRDRRLVREAKERLREAKARREAEAAARRRGSDYEQLKPIDFVSPDNYDTGVANDPASRAASKQAAHEKRQEFSLRMGQVAEELSAGMRAEIGGYGQILDAMTKASGEYIGELSEQERRFGNRRNARSVSLFLAGEALARRQFIEACQEHMVDRVVPTGYAARHTEDKPRKRSVCMLLSDLHIGAELAGHDNPVPFGAVEEARRLEYLMRQVIDYKPQYRDDSEFVLMIIGDVIEGLLLHDWRDGAPMTEQKIAFLKYFERFIGELAAAYPSGRVYFQPGNHGRDKVRHPGRATSSKWDGHETQLYYALYSACRQLRNVKFHIDFRAVTAVNLHGAYFGISHGDTEVKLGDPDTKAKDNLAQLDKINSTQLWGVDFAGWGFGHFHKPRYIPANPRVIFNGALLPPNGHARGAGYIGEVCGQWMWESVEGYPVGDVRFVEVGRSQDQDEYLGKIIEPFRFALHPGSMIVGQDWRRA